jgi:hypothetical protein
MAGLYAALRTPDSVSSWVAVAATAGLNTTLTLLAGGLPPALASGPAPSSLRQLQVGDCIRFRVWGTNTSTVAGITTLTLRIGTAGTTGDAAVMTVALPISAASGTTVPFEVEGLMTIRTLGAAATVHGTARLHNQNVTSNATASVGISVFQSQVIIPTFANFDSTASNFISLCHVTAATTTTNTIQGALLEWV